MCIYYIQIIKLLRYFSTPKEHSNHRNEDVTRELDELASKLSSIGLQEGTSQDSSNNTDDLEIMTSLKDVISKLHI